MKPDEGGGQVFTVSRDFKADNADALTVLTGEKLVLVKAEGGDPSKWLMQSLDNPKRKGWVPIVILTPKDDLPESVQQVIYKREAVISELVETEEEYCRDIMQVVDYYMKPLDGAGIPRNVCDNKDKVFGNYKDIAVFHNTVLLEGIKYYAKEPKQLGRAFLRMERDFDKHVTYCHDEPAAQDFLEQNESIRDYFDDLGSRISDDKNIGEHLKLPVQRINDYQLLLKELVKYSERLEEDTTDLNKALELMLGIPHKADDLKYITNIEGYHGDIHKLGRLLRHNWFKVKGKDGKERERYLFLFKARILICKVRKIAGDNRYVFELKDIIRLPDVQVKDHKTEPRTFEVGQFTLTTHQDHVKEPWLEEIRQYSKNALTLAEHQADDLRLEAPSKEYPLKGVELILATPGNSSDEEMDKSSRRTSLSQRVQELRSSSITESSYTMTSSSKTVVMEVSSQGTHIEQSSHFESSSSGPTVIETIETQRKASAVEIEDMTSRCNLQSLFTKTLEGCTAEPGGSAAFECDIEAAGNLTWIKDNKPIDDRLHDRITQMSVGSHHRLEILNVAEADAGVYTAIAKTSSGKVSTCTANLVVEKLSEEEKKARDEANAPLFVVRLKDTEIMQNTFLRFMVKVKGNPNPTVKFYKDDVEITYKNERLAVNNEKESVGYYEMVIPSVQIADVGVYKCVATNSFGSATSEGRVTVVDEKKVFEGIVPPKRKPSANGTAAKDDAQFQWIKDGKPFDPEERFKVLLQDDEDSLALVFTHVKPEDAGLYTCVASTTSGKISCSAELTVQGNVNLLAREPEAPAINAAHKEVDSNVGSSAMLETKIKGYPKPDIKWFRDGKELIMGDRYKLLYEDEETISLVVKTVTSSDDGVYKVVASNAAGSSEDTVTLNIKAPPSFKKKLNDVRVTAGAELTLQIEVQANPKPDVQWFKDGKQITASDHVKLIEENETYTLMIEKSTLFDVGSYSVICKNNISQCSEFCKVEIEGAPVFTRNLIKKVETEEGDSLTFLVKVHGNPMPIVKWYFKGQPVVTDNRCKIGHDMDTHTLTINSINRKDAGDYTCELQNAHGSVKDHGVVMVKCSPEFSKGLGNLVAQEGDSNVGFSVNISSFPKGKVRWFINTKEISSTSTEYVFKEEENSYSMIIKEVTRDSAGTYTCKVENSYGFSDSSAELTVLCKPKFKQELKNVTVNAGDKLTLEIEILGTPAPEIKWFKDGNEITNDMHIKIKRDSQRIENYSLTVDLVKAEDSGEYEVRATNEMGSAISKSTVTVQTKSSSGFYDTSTSRTTKDDNSNTTLIREKYRETENTKNHTILNPISENHIDETTFFKPAYSTDEPDSDKNKQRRSSQKNSFAKRFNISVEDVFDEPVKIMSADEEEDDVTGGTEPLVSEPCTPMSPEKIKNRLEIEEVTDSSQRVIDIKIEVEGEQKGKNFERFESVAAKGSAVRTETITTRTMDTASGKGIEITTSTVERVELSERHVGTDEPPETKKALRRDKINRNESTETKPDLSELEKPDKAALDDESLKNKSELDLKKEQGHVENQSEIFATDKESRKDLPQQGSLDEDDPVEKLLKKSKEQRASLSQIIQRNQDTEESRLQALYSPFFSKGSHKSKDITVNTQNTQQNTSDNGTDDGDLLQNGLHRCTNDIPITEVEQTKLNENDVGQKCDMGDNSATDLSELKQKNSFRTNLNESDKLKVKSINVLTSANEIPCEINRPLDDSTEKPITVTIKNSPISLNSNKDRKIPQSKFGIVDDAQNIEENSFSFTLKTASKRHQNESVTPDEEANQCKLVETVTVTLKTACNKSSNPEKDEYFTSLDSKHQKKQGVTPKICTEESDKLTIKIPEILKKDKTKLSLTDENSIKRTNVCNNKIILNNDSLPEELLIFNGSKEDHKKDEVYQDNLNGYGEPYLKNLDGSTEVYGCRGLKMENTLKNMETFDGENFRCDNLNKTDTKEKTDEIEQSKTDNPKCPKTNDDIAIKVISDEQSGHICGQNDVTNINDDLLCVKSPLTNEHAYPKITSASPTEVDCGNNDCNKNNEDVSQKGSSLFKDDVPESGKTCDNCKEPADQIQNLKRPKRKIGLVHQFSFGEIPIHGNERELSGRKINFNGRQESEELIPLKLDPTESESGMEHVHPEADDDHFNKSKSGLVILDKSIHPELSSSQSELKPELLPLESDHRQSLETESSKLDSDLQNQNISKFVETNQTEEPKASSLPTLDSKSVYTPQDFGLNPSIDDDPVSVKNKEANKSDLTQLQPNKSPETLDKNRPVNEISSNINKSSEQVPAKVKSNKIFHEPNMVHSDDKIPAFVNKEELEGSKYPDKFESKKLSQEPSKNNTNTRMLDSSDISEPHIEIANNSEAVSPHFTESTLNILSQEPVQSKNIIPVSKDTNKCEDTTESKLLKHPKETNSGMQSQNPGRNQPADINSIPFETTGPEDWNNPNSSNPYENESKSRQISQKSQNTNMDPIGNSSQAIPKITESQMKNSEIFETWEATFQVTATGEPHPEAIWTRNGEVLEASQKRKMTDDGQSYKLEILDCQVEDEGEYKVTLKNVLGEDSDKASLSVISAKSFRLPQIQKPLVDQTISKNETVNMTIVLTADPIPEVEWKHGDKDLSTDKDIILNAESKQIHHGLKECTYSMTIPVSKHFDTGAYSFTASNKSGTVTSNAKLDIVLKPEFELFKDITIVPFEDATFLAVIRSNPRATLTWRKDGTKISDDDHYTIINDAVNEIYKLKISNVHPQDEGLYTLSAVNEIGEASADARLMVHTEQPSFTKTLEDISVRDYAQLELKIRAEGVPKPDISWAKDGIDLVETEGMQLYTRCEGTVSSTLTIPHFSEEYCGRYKARAQSLSGHSDTQCVVKMVQLSPSFSKALERAVNIEETDPVDLYCKVEASPRANIKWFKDGEELQPSENVNFSIKPDGTVKLRIESATPEDCGAYKLIAENVNGMETAICAVSVTPSSKKPEIVKRPEDLEVTEGTPMILEAKIIGFPLPEVKWFKDGIPVRVSKAINFVNSPGGLIGLSIEQAGVEHAGEYTLTVSNKLGEASATAKVSINLKDRKPEFHGHLVPTTVIEGFPAKLCIKIAGTPLPQLSWSLNGTPLEIDGEHLRVVELPDGMFALMIENTGPLDAGTYAVTASNSAGSVTSSAKLEVAGQARKDMPEEKPGFAYEMRDAHADEGSQLQFSIPFSGNPVPQVHWTRNGLPIKPDHRITLTNDGHKLTLQINPCEMGDIGEYVCRLCNQLGNAETMAKANVRKIFHAPVFSQKLIDMEQVIGLDGKLLCRVSGNPRPKISWFRNGKQIHEEQKYSIKREGDTCVLYIKECSPDDDGIFTCIAENRDGQDSCQATFKAVDRITSADKGEKPCFLKKIGDQEVINGITGRLTACVSGYPTPEVEWYRNGDRLYPSDRIKMDQESNGLLRLTVTHIDPAVDIGKYKVRIVNDHGEDECEASFIYDIMGLGQRRPVGEQYKDFEEFKLTGSPLPLADKPIISRMSDRRLTLSWKPSIPIGPREPVSYLVEMCEMPSGSWFIARSGLRSCTCEIRNLEPFRDYKFRVRVENKFGVSEPSPFSQTFRAKLLPDQPKFIPYLAPGIDFRPDTSPYFPKDFDIERPPHDGYSQAPRFLRQEHFTQYGVKGHNCNLFWFVYGYPKPKMSYFFNGEPIEMGGRYDSSYTRNGQATLFINRMLERDVGVYEAIAFNEHGEARQRVHLEIAEYPEFIKRPEEITILARQGGRIEARVVGVPYPDVKWFKDWQPLTHSARMKIQRYDPDHCVLAITDAITKDSGLYSITASNVAGAVSCSVMVHVEEKEEFPFHLYGLGHNIKLKTKNLSDFYDLGDELGRGTQGITYHAVERISGRNYAAKVMKGKGELKTLMHNELDIMNILRHHKLIKIHDGFETLDTIILVIELASGGELLDCLTKTPYTNENEIASYIRQLLVGLDYLHEQNIAHVGLTPGDILVSHSGGDGIKICDYGLARRIHPGQLRPEPFGMPEYVSPEIVKGEGVDLGTDMWSVGVITHLLLTGISLFKGANDMETLTKVREGFWEFNEEYWRGLSLDARDFITKLLVINVDQRMTVKEALRHPWLKLADYAPADSNSISTENLHNYYNSWKDWYSNASCRTWYRRRPLMGAFTHPSKMVYPPNYIATPTESPEREVQRETRPRQNLGDAIFSRQPIGYDVGGFSSESHYQSGPDTYLLQLRDVDFPVRLREYMKVAAHRHTIPKITDEPSHLDWQLPVIRERRRFTDVMDEEIDDERKLRINKYALGDSYTVRRLKHELGTRLDTHVEAEALIEATRQGQAPFMREKPQATAVLEGKTAELVCFAVGDPAPIIQWFKNDMMLGDSNRVKILDDEKGRSILKFDPAINSDTGIYKVVARNRIGQTVARARVVLAGVPDAPDSPEVTDISDTQALLRWKQPKHDGNDPVTCYMLQSKVVEGGEWKTVSDKIDHEFYLVQRLTPVTGYIFRLAAKNNIGWSDTGVTSASIRTKEEGTAKVQVSKTMKALQAISEAGHGFIDDSKLPLDYVLEDDPKPWLNHVPTEKYTLISEIYRGRFSVVVKAIDKSSDQVMVCKLFENSPIEEHKVTAEFEVLRRLKHERIANLIEAYMPPDVNYCAFVLEKLQGADILTYLSNRHEYNEQMVATTISQVLDALQYLHWRGLCHLDLQPDNIVMASVRSVQVKLIDFGCAQKVTKLGTPVKMHGALEFSAPEVICQEPAYPQSDIWSIGVLAYLLLSGVSPFHGESIGETRQNINFVRFRFEHLFKEITQEATRFLMQIFKRTPNKRPSAEECHEHRWLCPNEYMIKKRERAVFLGNRLKPFSELYHQQREQEASSLETLTCLVSSQGPLARSNSIAEELNTS